MPSPENYRMLAESMRGNSNFLGSQSSALSGLKTSMDRYVEPLATIVSSVPAEVASGYAGLAGTLLPGPQGQGEDWTHRLAEALTYTPKTKEGLEGLRSVGQLMEPMAYHSGKADRVLGDLGNRYFGPLGGAMAVAIPGAAMEVTGLKGKRGLGNLSPGDLYSDLVEFDDVGGRQAAMDRAKTIIEESPELRDVVAKTYSDLGYNPDDLVSPEIPARKVSASEMGEMAATKELGDISPDSARIMLEENVIPEGWMVHGRSGSQSLDTGNVIQLSEDWGVAESYGRNGSMWMIKESSPESMLDLSSQKTGDMEMVVKKALEDHESGSLPWEDDVTQAIGRSPTAEDIAAAVRSEFSPEKIVNSAQAFDNPAWSGWLADSFEGKAIVKTPDGGVVLDPDRVKKVKVGD